MILDSRVVVLVTAIGVFSGTSAYAQQAQQIPTEFHGVWGWGAEVCSAKNWRDQDTLHQIRTSDIEFWESECRVATLSRSTDDPEALVLRLNCSGEGEEWDMDEVWKRFDIGRAQYL